MSNPLALIVDDEPDILELLEITLTRMGVDTKTAPDLGAAKSLLDKHNFSVCLTDMRLPDGDGIDLVDFIQDNHPDLPTAVITAHGSMELAIRALKAGAFDFVSKPVDLKVLRNLVNTALKLDPSENPVDRRSRQSLLGDSAVMCKIRGTILKLARSQAPIYISGESGTGKELVAQLIHKKGPRNEHSFIAVNCGAIPHELMESEFFGHKKGSFTGAIADQDGLFQAADGGTLFLDEIAELPLQMQVKLLRAIQEKSVRPIGATGEISVDVRILSATHKNLAQLVSDGQFRQDLYYRINVIELVVPPLRDRDDDIHILTDHIVKRLCTNMGIEPTTIQDNAREALKSHPFPGNIRELENVLERAITLCEDNQIQADDLQLTHSPGDNEPLPENMPLEPYLQMIEKEVIQKALEETRWNKTAAAKKLGITFRALRYRLEKLGLE